jgi:hypothetical protein
LEQLETLRRQSIQAVFEGGVGFIHSLIRLQTSDNAFGQNVLMALFKENIENALKQLQKVAPVDAASSGPPSRNNTGTITTASHMGDDLTSININRSPKKGSPKKIVKKKKQVMLTPLQKTEEEIICSLTKTAYFYRLIQASSDFHDARQFYDMLNSELEMRHKKIERVKSTLIYLRVNLGMGKDDHDDFLFQGIGEKEIGSRLMQDVQAGILVNPVFVYSPTDLSKVGIPPLTMRDNHLKKEA